MSYRTRIIARGMLIAAKHLGPEIEDRWPEIADRLGIPFGVEATPPSTSTDDALTARIDALTARIDADPEYVDRLSTIAVIRLDDGSIISAEEIFLPPTEMPPDFSTLDLMKVLIGRISMDPNYLIEQAAIEGVYKSLIASALIHDPAYATDYSELRELHARVDSLTPGTPESDEALRELEDHLSSIATRFENDPDYAEPMQELMNAYDTLIQKVLEDPAYEGLSEQLQSADPFSFFELLEEQSAKLPDQDANLQELSSGFVELPEQAYEGLSEQLQSADPFSFFELLAKEEAEPPEQAAEPPEQAARRFIEGIEAPIAPVLAPNPETAPSPADLGPDPIDIETGEDLLDVDMPPA